MVFKSCNNMNSTIITITLLLILIITLVVSEQEKEQDYTITRLLRHIANIDNEHIKSVLSKKLSQSIGFGVGISLFPTHTDNEESYYRNKTHDEQRKLAGDYKFTPCANERQCNTIIATYTKEQVKSILESILMKLINVDGCLDEYSSLYGSCQVDSNCICPTFISELICPFGLTCLQPVCPSDCYEYAFKDTIDELVQYGVQVRKICSSCKEEEKFGAINDKDNLGYCRGYGRDATVSGLMVLPINNRGIVFGAMTSNIWSHVTSAATCNIPSAFNVNKANPTNVDINALVPLLLGTTGSASIAPDNMGYGSSYNYFKGYLHKTQYQTSSMPLWLKARRLVAEETSCRSEIGKEVVINGYSEGGYGAVSISEAMESYGANIIKLTAGGGPYKISSAVITEGYKDVTSGNYPEYLRFYFPLVAQAYSSTYRGIENFGSGQDLLSESWVSNGKRYTKRDAIGITTDLGGANRLNELVPTPMGENSLSVWNQDFVKFIDEAVNDGVMKPCENQARINQASREGRPVNRLCEALVANDLSDYINSITYPYNLCHSREDEVVPVENVQEENDFTSALIQVSGDHNEAGLMCIQEAVTFFNKDAYRSVVPQRTGAYCRTETPPTPTPPAPPPPSTLNSGGTTGAKRDCLTKADCSAASIELGIGFVSGTFPTKGCFQKGGKLFWSPGTRQEMTKVDLPGAQERIRCSVKQSPPAQSPPTTVEEKDTVCITKEACSKRARQMGIDVFLAGNYPTKGCYSKNGKSYWSVGTKSEISTTNLPGVQKRIFCKVTTPSPPQTSPPPPPRPTVNNKVACLTQAQCNKKRKDMGITQFHIGSWTTKGCYSKNGKAFFSTGGTTAQMSSTNLPGVLKRIWCTPGVGSRAGQNIALSSKSMASGEINAPASSSGTRIFNWGVVTVTSLTITNTLLLW